MTDFKRIFYDDIDALSNTNDIAFSEIVANPDTRLGTYWTTNCPFLLGFLTTQAIRHS